MRHPKTYLAKQKTAKQPELKALVSALPCLLSSAVLVSVGSVCAQEPIQVQIPILSMDDIYDQSRPAFDQSTVNLDNLTSSQDEIKFDPNDSSTNLEIDPEELLEQMAEYEQEVRRARQAQLEQQQLLKQRLAQQQRQRMLQIQQQVQQQQLQQQQQMQQQFALQQQQQLQQFRQNPSSLSQAVPQHQQSISQPAYQSADQANYPSDAQSGYYSDAQSTNPALNHSLPYAQSQAFVQAYSTSRQQLPRQFQSHSQSQSQLQTRTQDPSLSLDYGLSQPQSLAQTSSLSQPQAQDQSISLAQAQAQTQAQFQAQTQNHALNQAQASYAQAPTLGLSQNKGQDRAQDQDTNLSNMPKVVVPDLMELNLANSSNSIAVVNPLYSDLTTGYAESVDPQQALAKLAQEREVKQLAQVQAQSQGQVQSQSLAQAQSQVKGQVQTQAQTQAQVPSNTLLASAARQEGSHQTRTLSQPAQVKRQLAMGQVYPSSILSNSQQRATQNFPRGYANATYIYSFPQSTVAATRGTRALAMNAWGDPFFSPNLKTNAASSAKSQNVQERLQNASLQLWDAQDYYFKRNDLSLAVDQHSVNVFNGQGQTLVSSIAPTAITTSNLAQNTPRIDKSHRIDVTHGIHSNGNDGKYGDQGAHSLAKLDSAVLTVAHSPLALQGFHGVNPHLQRDPNIALSSHIFETVNDLKITTASNAQALNGAPASWPDQSSQSAQLAHSSQATHIVNAPNVATASHVTNVSATNVANVANVVAVANAPTVNTGGNTGVNASVNTGVIDSAFKSSESGSTNVALANTTNTAALNSRATDTFARASALEDSSYTASSALIADASLSDSNLGLSNTVDTASSIGTTTTTTSTTSTTTNSITTTVTTVTTLSFNQTSLAGTTNSDSTTDSTTGLTGSVSTALTSATTGIATTSAATSVTSNMVSPASLGSTLDSSSSMQDTSLVASTTSEGSSLSASGISDLSAVGSVSGVSEVSSADTSVTSSASDASASSSTSAITANNGTSSSDTSGTTSGTSSGTSLSTTLDTSSVSSADSSLASVATTLENADGTSSTSDSSSSYDSTSSSDSDSGLLASTMSNSEGKSSNDSGQDSSGSDSSTSSDQASAEVESVETVDSNDSTLAATTATSLNQNKAESNLSSSALAAKDPNQNNSPDEVMSEKLTKASRLGLYGGGAQAALLAGKSTIDLVYSRMGVKSLPDTIAPFVAQSNHNSLWKEQRDLEVWVSPVYRHQDASSLQFNNSNYGAEIDLFGLAIGGDYTFNQGLSLGMAFNVGSGESKGNGESQGISNDFDYYSVAVYGGYTYKQFTFISDFTYAKVDNQFDSVAEFSHVAAAMNSTYTSVGVTGQYEFQPTPRLTIAPHIGLRYSSISLTDFDLQELSDHIVYDMDELNFVSMPIGVTFTHTWQTADWIIQPAIDFTVTLNMNDDSIRGDIIWNAQRSYRLNVETQVVDAVTYRSAFGLLATSDNFSLGLNFNYTGAANTNEFGVNAVARLMF